MRPSEALAKHRVAMREIIAEFGAYNPRLFGSVARGEDTDASDIDIIVELDEGASYYQLFRIEDALSEILGCHVDVHLPGRPGSRFLERIAPDLRPL